MSGVKRRSRELAGEASGEQRLNEHLTREYQTILRRLAEAEIEIGLENGVEGTGAVGEGGEMLTALPAEPTAEGEGDTRDDLPLARSTHNGVSSHSPTALKQRQRQAVGNLSSSSNSTASLSSTSLEQRVSRTAQEPSLLSQVQALQGDAVALAEAISRGTASLEQVRAALASMQDSHRELVAVVATITSSLDQVNQHSGGKAARHIATSHSALREELQTLARHLRELEEVLRANSDHLGSTSPTIGSPPPPQEGSSSCVEDADDGSPYLPAAYLTPAPPPRSTSSFTSSPPSSSSPSSFPSLSLLLDMFTPNGSSSLVDSTAMAMDTPSAPVPQDDRGGRREGGDGGERENDEERREDKEEEEVRLEGVRKMEDTAVRDDGGRRSTNGYLLPSTGQNSSVLECLRGGGRSAGPSPPEGIGEEEPVRPSKDTESSLASSDEWDGSPMAVRLSVSTPPTNPPWSPRPSLTPEPLSQPEPLLVSSPCADSGISGSDTGQAPSSHPPILPSSLPTSFFKTSYNSSSHGDSDTHAPPCGISASDIEALRSELADLRQRIKGSSQWSQSLRQRGTIPDSASLQPSERAAVSEPASCALVPSTVHTPSVSKPFQTATVSRPYYTPTTSRPGHTAAVSRPYYTPTVSRPGHTAAVCRPYSTPTVSRPYYSSTVSRPYHTVTSKTTYTHSASTSTRHPDSTNTLTLHPRHTPLTPSHHTTQSGHTTSSQRRLFSFSGRERRESGSGQRGEGPGSRRKTGPPASVSCKESAARVACSRGSSPPKMVTCATQTTSSPAHSHTDRHSLAGAHSGTKTWNSGTQTTGGYTFLHYPELSFSLPQGSSTPRRWMPSSSSPPSQPTGSAVKSRSRHHPPGPPPTEGKAKPPTSPPLFLPPSIRPWQLNTETMAVSKSPYLHTTTGPAWSSYFHTTTGPAWSPYLHTTAGSMQRTAPPTHPSSGPHSYSTAPQPRHSGGKRSPSSSSSLSSHPQYSSPPRATHSSTSHHLPWELNWHTTTGHTHQSHS